MDKWPNQSWQGPSEGPLTPVEWAKAHYHNVAILLQMKMSDSTLPNLTSSFAHLHTTCISGHPNIQCMLKVCIRCLRSSEDETHERYPQYFSAMMQLISFKTASSVLVFEIYTRSINFSDTLKFEQEGEMVVLDVRVYPWRCKLLLEHQFLLLLYTRTN